MVPKMQVARKEKKTGKFRGRWTRWLIPAAARTLQPCLHNRKHLNANPSVDHWIGPDWRRCKCASAAISYHPPAVARHHPSIATHHRNPSSAKPWRITSTSTSVEENRKAAPTAPVCALCARACVAASRAAWDCTRPGPTRRPLRTVLSDNWGGQQKTAAAGWTGKSTPPRQSLQSRCLHGEDEEGGKDHGAERSGGTRGR